MNWWVSISNSFHTPGVPRRRRHQSCPAVLFLRDSHPSIHLPRSVYLSDMNSPRPGLSRFSFGAKNSSLANKVRPPFDSDARSMRSFLSLGTMISHYYFTLRTPHKTSIVKNFLSTKKGLIYSAEQAFTFVRCQFMFVMNGCLFYQKLCLRIPADQVRIIAEGNLAFPLTFANKFCRSFALPVCELN